jgi:hypothetical protein
MKALLGESTVLFAIESVKSSGPMSDIGLDLLEFQQNVHAENLFAKVSMNQCSTVLGRDSLLPGVLG